MSGGGEHLKDEVRLGTHHYLHPYSLTVSTFRVQGIKSWWLEQWLGWFQGKAFMPAKSLMLREEKRFCIAPLDVLKIRLQLQIHTLPNRSSQASGAAASHLIRRGTIQTFKRILHDEGVTVNFPRIIIILHHQLSITNFFSALGILERQHPRRTPLHNLRVHPILHIPHLHSDPFPSLPSHISRIIHLRRSRRRRRHNAHLPFRSPPYPVRRPGIRQSLRESAKQYSHHCPR